MRLRHIVLLLAVVPLVVPAVLWAGHADNGCDGCHVPHGGVASMAPLWSGLVSGETGNFTMYPSGGTLQATIPGDPDGNSLLCLGCHDDSSYPAGWRPGDPDDRLGTDLSGTHPISFTYDTALQAADNAAGGSLKDPATTTTALGDTINNDLLQSGKVQCTSCHSAHAPGAGMLKISNAGGALCKTCHGNL